MFQKGDQIVYGNSGVCRVDAIGPLEGARGEDRKRRYYTLSALHGTERIFVPVDTGVFMRPVLSREEADALIDSLPDMEPTVCAEQNASALAAHYHAAFESHKSEDLLQLMRDIYAKGRVSAGRGKTLGMIDQRYQKKAEELIYGEFAVALDIPPEAVEDYIAKRMEALGQA